MAVDSLKFNERGLRLIQVQPVPRKRCSTAKWLSEICVASGRALTVRYGAVRYGRLWQRLRMLDETVQDVHNGDDSTLGKRRDRAWGKSLRAKSQE